MTVTFRGQAVFRKDGTPAVAGDVKEGEFDIIEQDGKYILKQDRVTFRPVWVKCPCGHHMCKRQYIGNLGTFYQGSGFQPDEIDLINRAFEALAEKEAS